jgi:hypothetical protein
MDDDSAGTALGMALWDRHESVVCTARWIYLYIYISIYMHKLHIYIYIYICIVSRMRASIGLEGAKTDAAKVPSSKVSVIISHQRLGVGCICIYIYIYIGI